MIGRAQLACDIDERWNGPPPRCERKYHITDYDHLFTCLNSIVLSTAIQCEPPIEIRNGVVQIPKEIIVGASVTYICNDGYKLVGPNTLTCSPNGQYDGLPPSCEGKMV